jgi:hypothetical protein
LPASWGHMVERHRRFGEALTAVGTHRPMSLEEPSPRFRVGDASRGMRGELDRPVRRAALRGLLSASRAATAGGSCGSSAGTMTVLYHLVVSPMIRSWAGATGSVMMVRRTFVLRPFVAIGRVVKMSRQNLVRLEEKGAANSMI